MRKKVLAAIFITVVTSQIIGWALGVRTDVHENRLKYNMPPFSASSLLDVGFYRGFERFHDDRYPFRGWVIKARNLLDYAVFDTSPSPKVHIGLDGWLFYTESLPDYMLDSCSAKEKIREVARKLHELERAVEASGRTFLFMVAPSKASIYPEYVGITRKPNRCGKGKYDLLLEAFAEFPVRNHLRLDKVLLDAKDGPPLYSRTDTHWNVYGVEAVTEAVFKSLAPTAWRAYMPTVVPATTRRTGDLGDMISMFGVDWTEDMAYAGEVRFRAEAGVETLGPLANMRPRLRYSARPGPSAPVLPPAVLYRDSFMSNPLHLLGGVFSELNAIWSYNIPTYEGVEAEDLARAKIILVEVTERHIDELDISM